MHKNKLQYLTFSVLIVSFAFANCVSAARTPEEQVERRAEQVADIAENNAERAESRAERRAEQAENVAQNSAERAENRVERTENREEARETRIENRNERRMARLTLYVRRVIRRFDALISREYQIGNRIQTRIEIFEQKGFDNMISATEVLDLARTKLEALQEQVTALEIPEITEGSDAQELFADFRTQVFSLKQDLRDTHIQLVQSVRNIRNAVLQGKTTSDEDDAEDETDESNE